MSPKTYKLLAQTGFNGLTITDAYDTPALTGYKNAERRAIQAGADLLMFGQITSNATGAYGRLLADVRAGRVRASSLRAGANEILAEKSRLAEAGL
jgi:beta-glucosidase-like glycosyl hydrolase